MESAPIVRQASLKSLSAWLAALPFDLPTSLLAREHENPLQICCFRVRWVFIKAVAQSW